MDKRILSQLSKAELIQMFLKQNLEMKKMLSRQKPTPTQQPKNDDNIKPRRPIPTPRKSVKQMVQDYEENIILPPPEFRDDYKPVPLPRTKKLAPVPLPRTKICQRLHKVF